MKKGFAIKADSSRAQGKQGGIVGGQEGRTCGGKGTRAQNRLQSLGRSQENRNRGHNEGKGLGGEMVTLGPSQSESSI